MGLLVAAALLIAPAVAHAQPKSPAADAKGDAKPSDAPATDAPANKPKEGGDAPADGAGDGGICEIDPKQCQKVDLEAIAKKPIPKQMYAVQQIYALRMRRVEVNPYWSFTLNDQFVTHPAPGLAINYYITNVFAVGLNGNWYRPFGGNLNQDSTFNSQARRAARIAVPLQEYDWSAALNFTYVPFYGKFAGFGDFIFSYDAYLVGGIGALSDRPIAVVDPDNRTFDSKINVAFNVGLGLRIFFNRWFTTVLEVRDYIYPAKLEATTEATSAKAKQDPATWYEEKSTLTNNVQAQIGISIFIPFSFEYKLPK